MKAPAPGAQISYDAGKKIVGRKRHIAVDTDGRLMFNVTSADISDSVGVQVILDGIRKRWRWVKHLFADGAALGCFQNVVASRRPSVRGRWGVACRTPRGPLKLNGLP